MLFDQKQDLDLQPPRTKTLLISLGIHLLLVAMVVINPEFLSSTPKRIIRIAGQDYDLSKNQLTELVMPPAARPKPPAPAAPPDDKPLIQPPPQPNVQPPQPPPPPPPPPPPAPQTPPVVISPEDVIADGARPDAPPKPSRGDTTEAARAGSAAAAEAPKPDQPKQDEKTPTQIARNTNPNALRLPNLQDSAGRIVQESIEEARKRYQQGPRTGLPGVVQEDPNFSTEEPTILSDTRGYDFGPYMNQVVNRVRVNWYSLIPEVARLGKKGRVVIIFTIAENGTVQDLRLVANSGTEPLDRAATGAITASNPFQKLPAGFDGDHLVLQFTFLYNIR
jgi:TonB family protein